MFQHEYIVTQPVFFLFVAFSFLLTAGYLWGRRQNKKIFQAIFKDLMDVIRPDDQTFTNIGGAIGYHAKLLVKKKGALLSQVDATITLLPRHSLLYLPISKIIRKYDRLFITLYLKHPFPEESHLIEAKYNGFRGSKIDNADRLTREDVKWGKFDFHMYCQNMAMRDHFARLMKKNPDPGTIRHIAFVPHQKKIFIFMIPQKGSVARYLAPVYQWLPSVFPKGSEVGRQ
ncbi:MAG: hypothetical protein KJ649_08895 [Proteobacteria bacterium]|nr:hypothetical protein [Pseudomonadota bacterium]MBU1744994.1 hypothetical protein [Pseudomonadota bacterium]